MAGKQKPEPYQMRNPAKLMDDLPIQNLSIDQIQLPASQPRCYFDPTKMAQLVESVRSHGILEPLLVRPLAADRYELVAGERRLRAAREVGLKTVPIVSKPFSDQEAAQVALLENLQREDLNPIEETEGILQLLMIALQTDSESVVSLLHRSKNAKHRGQKLNQNVLVQLETIEKTLVSLGRFSIDSFRTSRLPLLKLPADILEALRQGQLEYTKAIALSRLKDDNQRAEVLAEVIAQNWSLGQIRSKIQALTAPKSASPQVRFVERYAQVGKQLQKAKVWKDATKRKRLNQLLGELEQLIASDEA
jgi:ParB family transcriptional regulator, chromosome partitioning protein